MKNMKGKLLTLVLFLALMLTACGKDEVSSLVVENKSEETVLNGTSELVYGSEQIDPADWEKAKDALKNMGIGWNLGNTLETVADAGGWFWRNHPYPKPSDFETYWGNPVTKPIVMERFHEAGFGFIRVPVSWAEKMDGNMNISKAWMDRVQEVVDYVLANDMYCILNVHHDTGAGAWLKADAEHYDEMSKKFIAIWTQVAERFKDYDYHLIFEGFNEILDKNDDWNANKTTAADLEAVNRLNQDFVNTIRASKSPNNKNRNLVCNTYAAGHSDNILKAFKMPTDSVCTGRLMAEIHMYSPYNFALNEEKVDGKAPDTYKYNLFLDEYKQQIISEMQALKNRFTTKLKVPLIIGEWGATKKNNLEERCKHAQVMVYYSAFYGFACCQWMGMMTGNDRTTGTWTEPELRDIIINTYRERTSVDAIPED